MFARVARTSARHCHSKAQAAPALQRSSNVTTRLHSVKHYPGASLGAKALQTSFELPHPNFDCPTQGKKFSLTKIVATIGPTSEQLEPLQKVVTAGMKIMRLNFSHATTEEVELRMTNLAMCQVSTLKFMYIHTI
jgi:hypothetical protein